MTVAGVLTGACVIGVLVVAFSWVARSLWGMPEDGGSDWDSALDCTPPVQHVEVSLAPAPAGAIGTMAVKVSAAMAAVLTTRELAVAAVWDQAHEDHDLWLMGAAVDQAYVDYETRMLSRREWSRGLDDRWRPVESTQQRIDRWIAEGEDGYRDRLIEVREGIAETPTDWPTGELPQVHQPKHQRAVAAAYLVS